ncbi:MAG TPA: hypothetical protein VFC63_17415 [Blastocatellia bacterium]|nr:hypothetical protein [Blastocatellia bacterium]
MTPFEYLLSAVIIITMFGQVIALYLIYGMIKRLDAKAADMQARLNPILAQSTETLAKTNRVIDEVSIEVRACVAAVSATTVELSRLTLEQANELSGFMDDATASARYQIGRLERAVSVTTDRIEETTLAVQGGIIRPVKEVSAIIIAVKRALEVLFNHDRKQIDKAYSDEEMFI